MKKFTKFEDTKIPFISSGCLIGHCHNSSATPRTNQESAGSPSFNKHTVQQSSTKTIFFPNRIYGKLNGRAVIVAKYSSSDEREPISLPSSAYIGNGV
ncbi:hypothetical protein GWI33_007631 [Rhynchophorus ferrugineus]|uniref:Uncharacterized protein n=1 Tax=Rhynchophorus ferrugineus TaxID=354439 RepID=A0A834MCW6_RHYFE|nr:hypothetical protein GWI33_007631 [Rhynchophorus ferrugineus]